MLSSQTMYFKASIRASVNGPNKSVDDGVHFGYVFPGQ